MSKSNNKINVALIGTGNFAQKVHLPNAARIPECKLRAVCDVNAELVKDVSLHYKTDYWTTDYQQILADKDIDAVILAVRDNLHANFAIQALQSGKHVYVEKPLSKEPKECEKVIEAQRQSGKYLAVGFNRRYAPIYQLNKKIISEENGAYNIHMKMADDAWRWARGYPPGYLLILDLGHFFDLLRWFTETEVESVYCISSRPEDDCLAIKMKDGCVASIMFSGNGSMDMPKEHIEIITNRGGTSAIDFVELTTYGYRKYKPKYTFTGHSNPEKEYMHKYLFKQLGLEGLKAIRRSTWELRQMIENNECEDFPDYEEIKNYVNKTIPNFMRDQGWMSSLREFICGTIKGGTTQHADAYDALAASKITAAVVESRETGEVVYLKDFD